MYRHEVPLYDDLLKIVHDVDECVIADGNSTMADLPARHELERHGAIRLALGEDMRTVRRLFAVMGMHPVGYYDLTLASLPLHATAFRPISQHELAQNPFRVFTSLLRFDLLPSGVREKAEQIANNRRLFKPRLLELIDLAETGDELSEKDSDALIIESLEVFRWHAETDVSIEDYEQLKHEHPVVADIVCFPTAHINHLTPRTLDIDRVQRKMQQRGLPAKEIIEGPPQRCCDVLLRQTSFKALEEKISFRSSEGNSRVVGVHTARFGEVEQRGAAMTPKGRKIYDKAMEEAVRSNGPEADQDYALCLEKTLRETIPDDWAALQRHQLVYFHYTPRRTDGSISRRIQWTLSDLVDEGLVSYEPITYEDFLPLSAAGIFTSNLSAGPGGEDESMRYSSCSAAKAQLEEALGCSIVDEFERYEEMQTESIRACADALSVQIIESQ